MILNNLKIIIGFAFIVFFSNAQVLAQVQTFSVSCLDEANNITYTADFQGKTAILVLRGHTYRIPFSSSHVDVEGLRWSVYRSKEIHLSTTLPNEKWVGIWTAHSRELIAFANCNKVHRIK